MRSVSRLRAATFRRSIKEKQRMQDNVNHPTGRKAYIITGPTSGIGLATAFEVAKHGTVVLGTLHEREFYVRLGRCELLPLRCQLHRSSDIVCRKGCETLLGEKCHSLDVCWACFENGRFRGNRHDRAR